MQKKSFPKLSLNRETLITLTPRTLELADGGGTTITSNTSNPTLTCETCFGTCSRNTLC